MSKRGIVYFVVTRYREIRLIDSCIKNNFSAIEYKCSHDMILLK